MSTVAAKDAGITDYALSPTRPDHLYACTSHGLIYKWDWVQGVKLGRWDLHSQILGLLVGKATFADGERDLVYTKEYNQEKGRISAHKLMSGDDAAKTESKTVLLCEQPITAFQVVLDGKIIVLAAGRRLLVGAANGGSAKQLREMSYIWREVLVSDHITCLSTRHVSLTAESLAGKKKPRSGDGKGEVVDVVIGHVTGVILLYQDLLSALIRAEHQGASTAVEAMTPRRLHWHREPVLSIGWSMDGTCQSIALARGIVWLSLCRPVCHIGRLRDSHGSLATRHQQTPVSPTSLVRDREHRGVPVWVCLRASLIGQLDHSAVDVGVETNGQHPRHPST